MAYTTINKSTDHFNTKTYTGTGAAQSLTGVGFQPDWTWIKPRSYADNHVLFDAVRGVDKRLIANTNAAQGTVANMITAFDSDGISIGDNDNVSRNSETLVAWNWKGAGSTASNSNGSVTSTVSANTTAGFSICKFTFPSSGNFTFGHGLGVAPKMFILKGITATANWQVYNEQRGNTYNTQMNYDSASSSAANWWGSTSPTNTVCTVGADLVESGQDGIAYCFAEKRGYSKFGTYTGNGNADGVFVYTGFKPAWVMIKRSDNSSNWHMQDSARIGYNTNNYRVYADVTDAETSSGIMDFVSNGFKFRSTAMNTSSGTFIYMAFGQSLVGSNNIPSTAR